MEQQIIANGGLQYIPQIAVQYVYLDFDGGLTSYNGEILTVDNVEVLNSSLTAERIANIVAELNERYASKGIQFVTQRPATADYSTIFVGKTDAFDQYGTFKGLAETIDEGNADKTDKAFVNLDTTATDAEIIATISHETDHLTGTLDHGGEGLQAYASDDEKMKEYYCYYHYNETFTGSLVSKGLTLWHNSVTLSKNFLYSAVSGSNSHHYYYDSAYGVTIGDDGSMYVSSGGKATATTLNDGNLTVYDGGTATSITVNGGRLDVRDGGTVTSITMNGGYLEVHVGGTAIAIKENGGDILDFHDGAGNSAHVTFVPNTISGLVLSHNSRASLHSVTTATATTVNSNCRLNVYGGTAISTTVNSDGLLYVCSGGTANSTTVNSGGDLYVSRGTATATTVNEGCFYVCRGGVAISTTVNNDTSYGYAYLCISSGGTATSTIVNRYGQFFVSSGCTATYTTVNSSGALGLYGGMTISTTVNFGGYLALYGGTATFTTVNSGGYLNVSNGGTVTYTTVNSRGAIYVANGGTATSTTLNGGDFDVRGTATATTVNGGDFNVRGTATSTTVNRGVLSVKSGGTATSTILNSGGYLNVYLNGSAIFATVNSGGSLYVSDEGTVTATTVNFFGVLNVRSGGAAISTTVNSGGVFSVYGGRATSTTLNGGSLYVQKGGTVTSTTVNSGGYLKVSNGGTMTSTTVNWGYLYISGGTATSTTVNWGYLYISSGTATSTTLNEGCLYVSQNGVAKNVIVNSLGQVWLEGGSASDVTIYKGGYVKKWRQMGESAGSMTLIASSGLIGTATNLNGNGSLSILSGAVAYNTVLSSGIIYVSGGGSALQTIVSSGAIVVSDGGYASNVTVYNGSCYAGSDANLYDVKIMYGGSLTVNTGAHLKSQVTLGGTMYISGAIDTTELDSFAFVLEERSGGNSTAMLNDISLLNDVENYSISVLTTQKNGQYKLAGNAADFTSDVNLTVNGCDAGVFKYDNGMYNSIQIGEEYYALILDQNNDLCLQTLSHISIDYSIDEIDQIVYYNGPWGDEFDGVAMKVPYSATATITLDKDTPDGEYEFVTVLDGIEGAEQKFSIQVLDGMPVYLSSNACYYGTKISETAENSTWTINVNDFVLTEKIKKSMTVAPEYDNNGSLSLVIGGLIAAGGLLLSGCSTEVATEGLSDAQKTGYYYNGTIKYEDYEINITPKCSNKESYIYDKYEISVSILSMNETITKEVDIQKYGNNFDSFNITIPTSYELGVDLKIEKGILCIGNQKIHCQKKNITLEFALKQKNHCGIAVASNMLYTCGYLSIDAQQCFDTLSNVFFEIDKQESCGGTSPRVFDRLNLSEGEVYTRHFSEAAQKTDSNEIDKALKHLNDNENVIAAEIGFVTPKGGQHSITCYTAKGSGKRYTIDYADSDVLTLPRISSTTLCKKNNVWYIHYLNEDCRINAFITLIGNNNNEKLSFTDFTYQNLSGSLSALKYSNNGNITDSLAVITGSIGNAIVQAEGTLEIAAGAVGDTITVHDMAALKLNSGASVSGEISTNGGTISTEAGIDFADDASINFDLISLEGKESAMLDDLAHVAGVALTVTVEAFQAEGRYVLANGVADFDGEITVYGDFGTSYTLKLGFFIGELGTLSVGDELKIGNQLYSLDIENDSLVFTVSEAPLAVWDISADTTALTESPVTVTAVFSDDIVLKQYSFDGETWYSYDEAGVVVSGNGTLYFRGADANGDYTDVATYDVNNIIIRHNGGSADGVTLPAGHDGYLIEYSKDNFENYLQIETDSGKLNTYGLAAGSYNWQFWAQDTSEWWLGNDIVVTSSVSTATNWTAKADGNTDLFFANAKGCWESGFSAQHQGFEAWEGTAETCALAGKNKLADIFEGSSDANVLVLTDDTNGDALFVDDIYTALPGTVAEQQARIAQIDEIRAGAGDDIVDMTSQRFEYVGDGVKIYGGLGNDTIWANNGSNTLFGDAGNDRLVGGSDNDVIVGGIGNDSMHGGGGNDIFCFGGDWGNDTVEQLTGGSVTLWFEDGSESNWNESTLTYTDGANSVKVSGIAAEDITLKFGETNSAIDGAFADAVSEKIFEDKNSGMLA